MSTKRVIIAFLGFVFIAMIAAAIPSELAAAQRAAHPIGLVIITVVMDAMVVFMGLSMLFGWFIFREK